MNDNRAEKNRKNNMKKKEKKKARAAAIEGAVVEEAPHFRSEALAPELAPSHTVESERPVADDNNNQTLLVGDFDKLESDDEEVELCRCVRCLKLEEDLRL